MASTPSSSVPQSFSNFVPEKLDDSNYLHWRQHDEPVIKSHRLQRFVVIRLFLLIISQRMIVLLIVPTLILKPGRSKIKHSWYGCSQLFLNQYCRVFLVQIIHIRFGIKFMSILAFTQKLEHDSSALL